MVYRFYMILIGEKKNRREKSNCCIPHYRIVFLTLVSLISNDILNDDLCIAVNVSITILPIV